MLLWRGDAALLQQLMSLGQWQWSLLADSWTPCAGVFVVRYSPPSCRNLKPVVDIKLNGGIKGFVVSPIGSLMRKRIALEAYTDDVRHASHNYVKTAYKTTDVQQ